MSDSSPATAAAFLSVPGSTPAVQPPPPQGSAPPPPAELPPNRLRPIIVRALIVGLAVLAGGLFMVDWDDLLLLRSIQRTDDAYLRGDPTTLSARVPGYVHRVAVADLETVKEGQALYRSTMPNIARRLTSQAPRLPRPAHRSPLRRHRSAFRSARSTSRGATSTLRNRT